MYRVEIMENKNDGLDLGKKKSVLIDFGFERKVDHNNSNWIN